MGLGNLIFIVGVAFVVMQTIEAQMINLDPGSSIPCMCPAHLIAPVCGTDLREYLNECELICASRYNPGLRKYLSGKCPIRPPVRPPIIPIRPPCICPYLYNPVCGTDGKTYSNECELNCAKQIYFNLRILRLGRCDGGRF